MDGNSYNGDLNQIKSIKTFKRHFHQKSISIYILFECQYDEYQESGFKSRGRNNNYFVTFYETF